MLCSNSPRLRSAQPPLFETSPITMCPSLACTPSTGLHASPPIKIHPVLLTQSTPLLISVSHSSSKSPSFALLIQGGVLCSPLVVYVWCYTPPTANAYTTRSCYARLPAPFGHIILSCGVQFNGNRGGENLTAQYRYAQCGITAI